MSTDAVFRELDNNFINFDEGEMETYNYVSTDTVVHWNWKLDIPISTPGSIVSYTFKTTGGDISFMIAFEGLDIREDVLEEHRVPSHIEPISGAFKAPREGSVCLYWDNSFSWLTPKKLSYSVTVKQPSFSVADHTRSVKAQSVLHNSMSETQLMEMRLAQTIENEKKTRAEIPELKRQFDQLKAMIEQRLDELKTSQQETSALLEAIQTVQGRVNGLCIRMLQKPLLREVLSYLSDSAVPLAVCKYWRAVAKENQPFRQAV